MPTSYVALITPLSGYEPGVPERPTPPGAPVYPSTGPVLGGGHPSQGLPWAPGHPSTGLPPSYPSGQPLPPEGQPGSPSQPIAPVPAPEPGAPPAVYIVVPGYGLVGPIYLPTPKPA